MNFGHFDDDNKEYVITTPDTPCPGSTTLAPRISFHWFPTPAAATASIKMRSCFESPAIATTISRQIPMENTTISKTGM